MLRGLRAVLPRGCVWQQTICLLDRGVWHCIMFYTLNCVRLLGAGAARDGDGSVVRGDGPDAAQPHPPRAAVRPGLLCTTSSPSPNLQQQHPDGTLFREL